MEKIFSTKLAAGLTLLTLAGLLKRKKPKHFLGLFNVDAQHSALRIPLLMSLLHGGSKRTSLKDTRATLAIIGVIYLVIGISGTTDKRLGGLLPLKLTNFDLIYHFSIGTLALWLGGRSGRMMEDNRSLNLSDLIKNLKSSISSK